MVLYDFGQNADTADFAADCAAHIAPSGDSVQYGRSVSLVADLLCRLIHPVTLLLVDVATEVLLRFACVGHARKMSACPSSARSWPWCAY